MLYNVNYIKEDIIEHVKNKKPFSLVRVGDGDLKLLVKLNQGMINEVKFKRSGIPNDKGPEILKMYRESCNFANYTSSFEMYYTNRFWSRDFSASTKRKVKNWKKIYTSIGIKNENFCNPEIGYLLFLKNINLLKPLKNKKICLITCFADLEARFKSRGFDVFVIRIPRLYQNHYSEYNRIVKEIKKKMASTDIFLIGAGALGFGYALVIKKNGGIAVDVGQVMNTWKSGKVAKRFRNILKTRNLLFELTNKTKKYEEYL